MGYGLMTWAVDLDRIAWACGAGGETLRRMIGRRFGSSLERLADTFADEIAAGAPSPFDALATLVQGGPMEGHGFMYAYALELIVEHYGTALHNTVFCPCNTDFLESVDGALAALGLPAELRTTRLQYGTLPLAIPRPDDFPGFGHWTAELAAAAHEVMRVTPTPDALEPSLREAVETVRGWLIAAVLDGRAIVGFYH